MRSWLIRQFRGWLPDGNPLRRGTDRAGALIGLWLLVMAAVAMVTVTPAVSHLVAGAAGAARRAQVLSRHQVSAVLLQKAVVTMGGEGYPLTQGTAVMARWASPPGQRRTGLVTASGDLPAGARVPIWVDRAGAVTSPPMSVSQVAVTADLAGIGAVLVVAAAALGTGLCGRRVLDRRRMAGWDAEWAAAARRWHHHRW